MTDDRPGKASTESERRFATVVFADISGFTSMSERMDPEDVTTIMNGCFDVLEDAVTAHGGHVDKYIGDCIMAVFGVPKALERAPERAVRATIEMRRRIDAFNREHDVVVPLEVHAGINSGLVLAGDVGGATTRDFTVMGDTVNLASRLKDLAPKGAIWVGPQTYRYTRDVFEYEPLGLRAVKGKAKPIPTYGVLGIKPPGDRPATLGPEGMITSSLVGRDRELAVLRRCVRGLASGHGGIVNLIGEAGLGKSRLLAEMSAWPELNEIRCLRGGCVAIGRTLPFHPFIGLFRDWARIAQEDGDETAFAKLDAAVGAVAAGDKDEIVAFVATVMSLRLPGPAAERVNDVEGDAREKLLAKNVRTLFERMAAARPTMVVLEDLHWMDQSSVHLLEALLRPVRDHPLLFVHAFRPGDADPVQRVVHAAKERHPERCVDVVLEPLGAKECDRLVRNLLGVDDLPYASIGTLLRNADGNPFFIEEVLRSLIDEGAIEERNGRFTVTERIASVVVPGTIHEVIMGRIDRLAEPQRRVLQVASIIGRSFRHRLLAEVLGDAGDLEWSLAGLKKRQLIVERRRGNEVEYTFKHALAQKTIYDSILQKTRKELHASVARAIESSFAERLSEFSGMLAYHYSRSEHLDRAEDYLFKAGDEAIRSAASTEALEFFQEASRLYLVLHGDRGDPKKKALLEKNIALALLNKGRLVESIPHFNKALEYLGEPVPRTTARLALRFALDAAAVLARLYVPRRPRYRAVEDGVDREVLQVRFNRAKAQTTTDTTRFFLDTIGSIHRLDRTDPSAIEEACGMYAGGAALFSFTGMSFGIAGRFLEIARSLVRDGNVRDMLTYGSMRFIHHFLHGDWRAEPCLDDTLVDEGLRHGQLWDVSTYLCLCSERKARQGDFAGARAEIAKLSAIAEAYGSDFARSCHDGSRAVVTLEERRLEEATEALRHYYTSRVEKLFNLLALGWTAKLWMLRGEDARAASALGEAETIIAALGRQVPSYHRGPYALSRFMFDVGVLEKSLAGGSHDVAAARRQARRSWRGAVKSAHRVASDRVETYKLCGRLCWLVGRESQASRWWTRSLAEGERLGARPELARTHLEIGRRLAGASAGATRSGLDARSHLRRARELFTELGLTWDLEQLDALRPSVDRGDGREGSRSSPPLR